MSVVESVNGNSGVVTLKATDVEAIPGSEAGQPNGVATLDTGGKLTEGQLPSSVVTGRAPAPSGDETGATDTAALEAAMPAQGTMILRGNAPYYVTKLPPVGPGQAIQGEPGAEVYMVGSGTCFRVRNPSFPTEGGEVEFIKNMPGKCGGFVVDGSKAGAGAIGAWIGDINCTHGADIVVRHFTGAGSIGWLFKSEIGWCERNDFVNCHSINNSTLIQFDGVGTHRSLDYSRFDFTLLGNPNQHGIVMQEAVQFYGVAMKIGGGFFVGEGANTGVVWKLGADNSNVLLAGAHLDFQFEIDSAIGESGVGHKTIEMGTKAESHAHGTLGYFKGNTAIPWTAGNVTQPITRFTFAGFIKVDANLGENQSGEGLNVLGGSTWSRGFVIVAEKLLEIGVQGGDFFAATLANKENKVKLNKVYPGVARRIFLFFTNPTEGAAATVDWSEPGNNLGGEAQTIIWPGGAAPALQSGAGAVTVVRLISADGKKWYASVLGPTPGNNVDAALAVMMPVYARSLIPSGEATIGAANRAILCRAVAPTSGTLHDLTVFNSGAPNGNHNVAVFDTGQATAGKYTPLWESGSVAAAGENKPQVVGDPALAVVAGQEYMLAVMNSGTTHKFGTAPSAAKSGYFTLPAGFIPTSGGALPKALALHNYAELKYAVLAEAEVEASTATSIFIIGRIA